MSNAVFVLDAVRTPIGKIGGALAGVRPDDLASGVISALVERNPSLDPSTVDDVHFGNGNGAGEENRNVARMAALLAGLPTSVPGATANRLCGSGMEAVVNASREIAVGDASIAIAGGVEIDDARARGSCRSPISPTNGATSRVNSTTLGWRMVNPRHPGAVDRARSARAPRSSPTSTRSAASSRTSSRWQPPAGGGGVGRRALRRRGGGAVRR